MFTDHGSQEVIVLCYIDGVRRSRNTVESAPESQLVLLEKTAAAVAVEDDAGAACPVVVVWPKCKNMISKIIEQPFCSFSMFP